MISAYPKVYARPSRVSPDNLRPLASWDGGDATHLQRTEAIRQLVQAGNPPEKVAKWSRCDLEEVLRIAGTASTESALPRGILRRFSEEEIAELRRLRAEGWTIGALASKFGCAYETARKKCVGIVPRGDEQTIRYLPADGPGTSPVRWVVKRVPPPHSGANLADFPGLAPESHRIASAATRRPRPGQAAHAPGGCRGRKRKRPAALRDSCNEISSFLKLI
jgi:hypothetical protein